ncbi:hypothetical protein AB8A28_14000 [Tardiphaga sp. 71_E8_N1_1]|uniref:hypothetical protein n=1 Tax=Tardiphaga sp. 71_E8_N1_1 TaxID=3240784 RepID=UPI003F8C739E
MPNDTTLRGLPLPHPDNIAREDAGRIREAINEIDASLTALDAKETPAATEEVSGRVRLATAAEATAGTAIDAVPTIKRTNDMITASVSEEAAARTNAITSAIDALKCGVSTAYDTLVEIAAKFASDDGVIAGILSSIATKLNKAGDTMTGDLSIDKPTVQGLRIKGRIAGKDRWTIQLGDGAAEGGANAGSNLSFLRYSDAGVLIDTAFAINRATGVINTSGGLTIGGDSRITRSGGAVGYLYFGQPGASFGFDGTYFQSSAWIFSVRGARYIDTTDLGGYMPSSTAYGTFVTAVRGVHAGDAAEVDGAYVEIGNAWITGINGVAQGAALAYRYRYVQYLINGGWYTAGWAS